MSKTHELKTWPEFFAPVFDGRKPFEIRENDRDYQVGDILCLREFIPCPSCNGTRRVWPQGKKGASKHCDACDGQPNAGIYTGRDAVKCITYITSFAQKPRMIVMGMKDIF